MLLHNNINNVIVHKTCYRDVRETIGKKLGALPV